MRIVNTRLEWPEEARVKAIGNASTNLLHLMSENPGRGCLWSLLDVVWPTLEQAALTNAQLNEITISLVPLSRIGQMEGKSGSLVLVGRFWSHHAMRPSHPLIVKTRNKRGAGAGLADEWTNARAVKPYTYDRKDSFAIPIAFDDSDANYEVLWSLCLPSTRESEAPTIDFGEFPVVEDLRTLLVPSSRGGLQEAEKHPHAKTALDRTYGLLRNLHRASVGATGTPLRRDRREFGVEYNWYLRGYGPGAGSVWGPEWATVWGPANIRAISSGVNPLWLVDRLRAETAPMHIGTVHGDLHPGNVILRDGDTPAIIDFGWSVSNTHIAKDFALMECNLRFVALRPQLSEADLSTFAALVDWPAPAPALASDYLVRRVELIQVVRGAAQRVFGPDTDWNREYLVPLFLVGFGLLRFIPQLGNQQAAVRFIENLATHLANSLPLT